MACSASSLRTQARDRAKKKADKAEASKEEFNGKAQIGDFEFNSWSKGDMDRIYYGDVTKRRSNGLVPSEGYIDAQTGEIVKEGNWAGYQAAEEFVKKYNFQTPEIKERARANAEKAKTRETVREKISNKSTKFTEDEMNVMTTNQLEKVATQVAKNLGKRDNLTSEQVYDLIVNATKSEKRMRTLIKKYG